MEYLNNWISDEIKLALLSVILLGLYSFVLAESLQKVNTVCNLPEKTNEEVSFVYKVQATLNLPSPACH